MKLPSYFINGTLLKAALLCFYCFATHAHALTSTTLEALSLGDTGAKIEAINAIASASDLSALPVLQALKDGTLHVANGKQAVIVSEKATLDALTQKEILPAPTDIEKVTINNRLRGVLGTALATLKLASDKREVRLAAAKALQNEPDADLLPLIEKTLLKETDSAVKAALQQTQASIQLKSPDRAVRLNAVKILADSAREDAKNILAALLEKNAAGNFVEQDEHIRTEIKKSVSEIDSRLTRAEYAGRIFSGASLGSILLLAALGLAITYGLMGVINMAHGEMLMIGAYATYGVQTLFRTYSPQWFDWYLLAALPVAFAASALVGMVLERSVIRHLYGRPLETLLATWGISLILIQSVRTIFGAQNVEVMNPSWMSGGFQLAGDVVLPYNRIVIIAFAFVVLALVWALLNRTRLGLFVRAVTQNRAMADCVGVPTGKIDMWAFGLGSGIAGLGGCALSQIGNVGPDLGQSYIVDSFMVVVLGGVGQLAGTVVAGLGLGVVNKILEPFAGAVLAKIFILVFIIMFIQKRPQGLFALKGRSVES